MKAVQINKYGGVDVLEVNEHVPPPTASEGQVLVDVHAAGLNPFDGKIRAGFLKEMVSLSFPSTLGGDFAGVITKLGQGVTELKLGDEVYGSALILSGGSGAFAEIACANVKNIARKPKAADFVEAASLPLVGVSAVQALEEHIKLQKGQKILVHGGAGGIGHLAIQLAKAIGGYVATTADGKDLEFVKSLGADEAIDYQTQAFEELLKDFDAVFDTVGGEVTNKSFQVLKRGGVIVSMVGQPNEELTKQRGVTAVGQNTSTNTSHLTRLAELVDGNKVKVHVDKIFPLDQVKEAFQYLEEGHPQGKVVLKIKD